MNVKMPGTIGTTVPALALPQLFDQPVHDFEKIANHAEVRAIYGFSATTLPSFQT